MQGRDAALEIFCKSGGDFDGGETLSLLRRFSLRAGVASLMCAFGLLVSGANAGAQSAQSSASTEAVSPTEADPSASLASAIAAACKRDQDQFAKYLTPDNAKAFRDLPADQRASVLNRISLTDSAGHPLLSTDAAGQPAVRCEVASATAEFEFGAPRAGQNLAFVPVKIKGGTDTEFGMVREAGGWRILSIGLVMFDIRQLAARWQQEDTESRELDALHAVLDLRTAIGTYQRAFDDLPKSLAQLGPAAKNEVSPEQANLIGADLASGSQGGYRFRYRVVTGADGNVAGFEIMATPESYGKNGRRSFFLDAAGKLHGGDKHGDIATVDDPVVSADDARN
jgi:hypothetical protein